jgi:penicillin-insensitive murein endopeptidase
VRAVLAVLALAFLAGGCVELGVVTDGSSISYGKPSRGRLIDGVKLPDNGPGFTTRDMWAKRGNRYGTNELVHLLKGVAKRMRSKGKDTRLVVADLSANNGGEAHLFHRSHQSGRDVDLLYYMRDAAGQPFEADSMRVFDRSGRARDGSGISVDIPRTWALVKELLTADEAYVQFIFMYQPIANKVIEYARSKHEDAVVIARAVRACKQPGDSAPHNDHMHVRIYCPVEDRQFGCVDMGPLELLAEREAEAQQIVAAIAQSLPQDAIDGDPLAETQPAQTAADVWAATPSQPPVVLTAEAPALTLAPPAESSTLAPSVSAPAPSAATSAAAAAGTLGSFNSLFRARPDRIDLRSWR